MQRIAHLGDFTFEKEVQRTLQPENGDKILDMGCGLGTYSKMFDFYVGVDFSAEQLQFAKKRFTESKKRFFVADFYCHEKYLVVEIDGKIHEKQKEHDELRTFIINTLGMKVIRFTNEEIEEDLPQFIDSIGGYL